MKFRPAVVLRWMVQHIIDFVCSAAPAIPSAVPQIFQTSYDSKVVSALLQSVNVLLLSSYLSNSQSKPSGVGKGELMWNSSAETESLYPASYMLVVVSELMQLNIRSTHDSVVVGLGLSAEFWSSFHKAHTPTQFLILSWGQCHTSTLSYIRLDFAPSWVLNPHAYHVSGDTKELSSRLSSPEVFRHTFRGVCPWLCHVVGLVKPCGGQEHVATVH